MCGAKPPVAAAPAVWQRESSGYERERAGFVCTGVISNLVMNFEKKTKFLCGYVIGTMAIRKDSLFHRLFSWLFGDFRIVLEDGVGCVVQWNGESERSLFLDSFGRRREGKKVRTANCRESTRPHQRQV